MKRRREAGRRPTLTAGPGVVFRVSKMAEQDCIAASGRDQNDLNLTLLWEK